MQSLVYVYVYMFHLQLKQFGLGDFFKELTSKTDNNRSKTYSAVNDSKQKSSSNFKFEKF